MIGDVAGIPFESSPNQSTRAGYQADLAVMHYTAGGSGRRTADWMREPGTRRSAHFVGNRDGTGQQLVRLDQAAWHAGASEYSYRGEMKHGCNRFSVGIELANHGLLHKVKYDFWYELAGNMYRYRGQAPVEAELVYDNGVAVRGWWEPYPEEQIIWLERLLIELRNKGITRMVGHEEIAMPFATRKMDPGPLFPWTRFGRATDDRRTLGVIPGGIP